MTRLNVYSAKGVKRQTMSLPKRLQGEINRELLAQAIRVYEARGHPGLSETKTRGEVRVSKAKIYRQKGTGRARHGARSAPIFVGGGVTHGPKGIKRELSLPKKTRQKALKAALSLKAKDGQLLVVDGLAKLKKTKDAASLINKIVRKEGGINQERRFTFAISDKNKEAILALRNIDNVSATRFSGLNAYQVYFGGVLVVDKEALSEKGTKGIKSSTSTTERKGKKPATQKAQGNLKKK